MVQIIQNNRNYNLILGDEITVGAKCKFFISAQNGLKAICANQGNHVE